MGEELAEREPAGSPESAHRPERQRPLLRLLAFSRPYLALLLAAAFFTVLFSAGRYGRAYLMKPLLDGVLLPVASGAPTQPAEREPDWLAARLESALPDSGSTAPAGPAGGGAPRDTAAVRSALADLLQLAFLIVLITPLALFARAYLGEYVLGRIGIDIKRAVARKLLALPLAAHHHDRSGDVLSRALNDAGTASEALKVVLEDFMISLTMLAIGVATLLYISWPLTLISLLAAPPIVLVMTRFGRRVRRSAMRRQEQLGEVTHRLMGILGGIKIIKAFGGENVETQAFTRETGRLFRRDMRVVVNRVASRAAVEALNSGAGIAMLVIGTLLVLRGQWGLTTGDIAAFATVLATTYKPVKNSARGWNKLMEQLASGERLFALLDRDEEPADAPGAVALTGVADCIAFEGVRLRLGGPGATPGTGTEVLRGVDLTVSPGEVVAIVGPTGAGKTSLMDLLLRFHDPTAGRITLDGRDLRDLTRASLHGQIGIVTQDPFLFDTTVRENIRYGRPEAREEEVEAAARTACVDEFVQVLPAGYDTEVGEFGARLSGGQRQRITIARALLKKPAILIFDEATSALDARTERVVQEAIEAGRGRQTIFIVAHRFSTIRRADRIVVLEAGRITQQGTHAELMAREGLYRELARLQGESANADVGRRAATA